MFVEKETMKKIDIMKNFRQVQFTTAYTLTKEQQQELFREKLERATRQSLALKAAMAKLAKHNVEDRV